METATRQKHIHARYTVRPQHFHHNRFPKKLNAPKDSKIMRDDIIGSRPGNSPRRINRIPP